MSPSPVALRCALPLAALLVTASPAYAATSADQAAAESLFVDGKRLAAAGDCAHAVPKLVESQRLDPGAGTLLNLGACYEALGKLASSYGAFKEAEVLARDAGNTARQTEAARRAEALLPRLSKLTIVVPPAARVPGFELKRDGSIVGEGQWGSPIPADPGQSTMEAGAPGYKRWSSVVNVGANGAVTSIEVPPLVKLAPGAAAEGPPGSTWSTQRTIGIVVGAVGLVGLGVAAGFTVNAASKNVASLPYCHPTDPNTCNQTGVDLRNQAFDAAHVATGMLIGGAVAAGAGLAVFLTAPSGAPKKGDAKAARVQLGPLAGPGLVGAVLQGVW